MTGDIYMIDKVVDLDDEINNRYANEYRLKDI